jgi:Tfp pilus assembly protein PilF
MNQQFGEIEKAIEISPQDARAQHVLEHICDQSGKQQER